MDKLVSFAMKLGAFVGLLTLAVVWIVREVRADYQYDRIIGSYWELSDRASTLQQKSAYLDQYVKALETANLADNNAVWLKTPDNGREQNMVALKSLQGRMHQIQGMDEQSFAYQTAIQQITAQEQGEAHHLTDTFEGLWYLSNCPTLWEWYDLLWWLGIGLGTLLSGVVLFTHSWY